MAPRSKHLLVGFVFSILSILVLLYIRYNITLGFAFLIVSLSLLGAELPDYDHFLPGLDHRDILTHSFFIPLALVGLAWIFRSSTEELFILGMFSVNYGIHLFIDLWPPLSEKKLKSGGLEAFREVTSAFLQGLTGVELKGKMAGTYLIHLPYSVVYQQKRQRKTFDKTHTRQWLVGSAFISIFIGVIFIIYPVIESIFLH
ncbi:MAG: hypothetical protein QXL15_01350 [Candidatus Korarchaeota archaeon]